MELTMNEPDLMHTLLEKCSRFLCDYARAFHQAGASGLIMAEPAAGLLSPRGMSQFSSAYIRQIKQNLGLESFSIILHNCAAKLIHLPSILETGLKSFHFGAPMDIAAALAKVPGDTVICGNLDPSGIFCRMTPEDTFNHVQNLRRSTEHYKNHVFSSGCDLPPNVPLANLDAFYKALE